MLSCGCGASTSRRLLSKEQSSLFFEPVEFDFELANLLVECRFQLLALMIIAAAGVRENLRQSVQSELFPLSHQIGMSLKVGGNLVNGVDPLDGFQCHLGFEVGAVTFTLRFHRVLL